MDELRKKYNLLVAQNEILRKENAELRSLLRAHDIEYKPRPTNIIEYKSRPSNVIDSIYSPISLPVIKLSLDERVALFMSLFKGRKDVLPEDGSASQQGRQVISLYVSTNGDEEYAIRRSLSAPNAPTVTLHH